MTEDEAFGLVREALDMVAADRIGQVGQVDLKTGLADLGLDSVITLDLLGRLEEQLKTTFEDDALSGIETLGDLVGLIVKQAA